MIDSFGRMNRIIETNLEDRFRVEEFAVLEEIMPKLRFKPWGTTPTDGTMLLANLWVDIPTKQSFNKGGDEPVSYQISLKNERLIDRTHHDGSDEITVMNIPTSNSISLFKQNFANI